MRKPLVPAILWLTACGRLSALDPSPTMGPSVGSSMMGASGSSGSSSGGSPSTKRDAGAPPARDAGVGLATGTTLYPIVMVHGFAVSGGTVEARFGPVLGALSDAGFSAFDNDAPAFDSIAVRGASLLATIEQVVAQTGAPAVNLVAHSMGGLDARYVASPGGLGRGDLIASISTISTPHRGTQLADTVNALMPYGLSPVLGAVSLAFNGLNLGDANVQVALADLSESYLVAFNAATPDDPRVFYQSWAGVATASGAPDSNIAGACQSLFVVPGATKRMDPLLSPVSVVVGHELADWPNDGVVAVESAVWGEFHGCLPTDHFNEIGDTELGSLVPFADPDPSTGFDLAGFYVGIARGLAARGD